MKRNRNITPRRPLWTPDDSTWPEAWDTIKTVESLRMHLQTAIKLELSTIPPYLCALYSIKDGSNLDAARIIRSVVVEEMLHMIMACNILNAIGGSPKVNTEEFVPTYPAPLLQSAGGITLNLRKFSSAAIESFLQIERPAENCAPPRGDKFNSIGQFYEAIRYALVDLNKEKNIFTGKAAKQVTPEHYYGSGGKLIPVYNLNDALLAIDEIVGQGEGIAGSVHDGDAGAFDQEKEVAHYFRFNEIMQGKEYKEGDTSESGPTGEPVTVDWSEVYNMKLNPKIKDYQGHPELLAAANDCNKSYMRLLDNIQEGCSGKPEVLERGIHIMYELKKQALGLMKIPLGKNEFAGPTFEYIKDR